MIYKIDFLYVDQAVIKLNCIEIRPDPQLALGEPGNSGDSILIRS